MKGLSGPDLIPGFRGILRPSWLWLWVLVVSCGFLRAQEARVAHRARMDVEALETVASGQGLDDGVIVSGYGSLERFKWAEFSGAESARTWSLQWNVHRQAWTHGAFSFVPRKSGRVVLRLRGPWVEEAGLPGRSQRAEVLFDSVDVVGARVLNGSFEVMDGQGSLGFWRTPQVPIIVERGVAHAGTRSVRVWHDGLVEQELLVTAGQRVTVTAWARTWIGEALVGEVGDASRGRLDLFSESVALDALCLTAPGDSMTAATWVDNLSNGVDPVWGRAEHSWAAEFGIAPWFWSPFEVRFVPRTSGEVRFHLKGPWVTNGSGRVRVQTVEWDAIRVEGGGAIDGDFEGVTLPIGWRDPGPGATSGFTRAAHAGEQALFTWHDGTLEARMQVSAGREVRISGFARSARSVDGVWPDRSTGEDSPAHRAVGRFQRGMNLGNFLEEAPGSSIQQSFGPGDLAQIAAEGFDHVRVPVAWHHHWRQVPGGVEFDAAFLARVDALLDQANAAGLSVLLDWHHHGALMADRVTHQASFVRGWEGLAEHFSSRPATVAFELLNEPHGELEGETLNQLLAETLAAVRSRDPRRTVFVGPGRFQSIEQLPALRLPAGESNVVVSVHCYEPFLFTHQGADWTGGLTPVKGVRYPGVPGMAPGLPVGLADWVRQWFGDYDRLQGACSPASSKAFRPLLAFARDWSAATGRPVHVGEFGVYRSFLPAGDSAMEYLRDMRLALAETGLAWALWEWKAGFGYWDATAGRPHPGAVAGVWGRPELRRSPVGGTVDEGVGLALSVEAFGHAGDGAFNYQWFRDGVPIPSATTRELQVPGRLQDAGTYHVEVSNGVGSTRSGGAVVRVRPNPPDVVFTGLPGGDGFQLSWRTEKGWIHDVWSASSLAGPWERVAEVVGDGVVHTHRILPDLRRDSQWFRVTVRR